MFFRKNINIESFEKILIRESGMRAVCEYEILPKDGVAEITFYSIRFRREEGEDRVPEFRAKCGMSRFLELMNSCRFGSWNGFHGSHPRGVLDGTMFSLEASVNGGTVIKAEGSQNFPKGYRDFVRTLDEMLR